MEQAQNPTQSGGSAAGSYTGIVPDAAYLAQPYVPFQRRDPQRYEAGKALARGTLFPGLDLPYLGMVNQTIANPTPLQELMAMSFAITELGLYLDTHPDDTEALALFRSYVELYEAAVAEYEAANGPLTLTSAGTGGTFNWPQDPWPWDLPGSSKAVQTAKQQKKEG